MSIAKRHIDCRFMPPVKGVDLEQALNYIALADTTLKFVYENYTASRLAYERGSRSALEGIVKKIIGRNSNPLKTVELLSKFVAKKTLWAGFYFKHTGKHLPPDRNMTEEQIIRSGYGWCNEQARVFCVLTQIAGIPSRLVFASNNRKHYGHVVCEVLLPSGWMTVDQSFGFCFRIGNKPVRAADVFHKPGMRAHFEPIYRKLCADLASAIGMQAMQGFKMAIAPNPIDGFKDLGFCNHFVH